MDCQTARNRFDALLEGSLPQGLTAELREHLAVCRECGQEYALLAAAVDALTGLERVTAPAALEERILARLARPVPVWNRAWARAAAAVVLTVGAAWAGLLGWAAIGLGRTSPADLLLLPGRVGHWLASQVTHLRSIEVILGALGDVLAALVGAFDLQPGLPPLFLGAAGLALFTIMLLVGGALGLRHAKQEVS